MITLARTVAPVAAVLICATACTPAPPRGTASATSVGPTIQLVRSADDGSHIIEVVGLPDEDLDALRRQDISEAALSALLRVSVATGGGGDTPLAMVGTYRVTADGVRFLPRFPLDPGRPYDVAFDPAQLSTPSSAKTEGWRAGPIRAVVSAPAAAPTAAARVVDVYPTSSTIPENQLRMYVSFSAPMSVVRAIEHLKLLDEEEREVEGAFLPLDIALWNPERTRFTALFDPGRVKKGILPNERMGRALSRGRSYTLVIDREWRDTNGNPLVSQYERRFSVGPPDTQPIDPATWRVAAPRAGGREALVVTFPDPLDYALLHRALIVSSATRGRVEGVVGVDVGETRWRFTPAAPWPPGEYVLTALPILEDGAGNQIGRPFEVHAAENGEGADDPKAVSLPFRVP